MALDDLKNKTRKSLQFRLEKFQLTEICAQVGFVIDVSYSMREYYKSGYMQKLNDRIYPVAERFDDNKIMDICLFDNKAHPAPEMTADNYESYVQNVIMKTPNIWNGTAYAPPIHYFLEEWFGSSDVVTVVEKPRAGFFNRFFNGDTKREEVITKGAPNRPHMPSYLIFQTDGETSDRKETEELIIATQDKEVYISFLGVGEDQSQFAFIKHLADKYPNVGFFHIENLADITDDELYDGLITEELSNWLKSAVTNND